MAEFFHMGGYGLYYPTVRNSVFDLTGVGASSWAFDFGSASTVNWEDSLAIVNNVFITGTSTHFVMRLPANTSTTCDSTNIGRQIRFGGNYIVSNKSSTPTTLVTGAGITTIPGLATSIANNEPDWVDHANYVVSGWSGFDYTVPSDTLRWGGSTGYGSNQRGVFASSGPIQYADAPWATLYGGASRGYNPDACVTLHRMASLVSTGVLAARDSLDSENWLWIQPPNGTPAQQAQWDLIMAEYQNQPSAVRQKLKLAIREQ